MNMEGLPKWHFEITKDASNYLLGLVLEGKKRATSSSLLGYESQGEPVPKEGDLSVITDWDGKPCCIIKTSKVRILPYNEITFSIAKLEGEDKTLESWRKTHMTFFKEEGRKLGYVFGENMPVVFEEFDVVEVLC